MTANAGSPPGHPTVRSQQPAASMLPMLPALPELRFAQVPSASRQHYQGDRLCYMQSGAAQAPALLMLHGLGGNSMHWRYQYAALADRMRVIGWNAPGYLLSDNLVVESPRGEDYALAVIDLADALGLSQFYLLGNSFGSAVAQCVAAFYPQRVLKMALTGTGIGQRSLSDARKRYLMGRAEGIRKGSFQYGDADISHLIGSAADPACVPLIRETLRATNAEGMLRSVRFRASDLYTPDLAAAMRMPVLLLQGDEDRVNAALENADLLLPVLPDARMEILPGLGHLPEIEAPMQVNALLRRFYAV